MSWLCISLNEMLYVHVIWFSEIQSSRLGFFDGKKGTSFNYVNCTIPLLWEIRVRTLIQGSHELLWHILLMVPLNLIEDIKLMEWMCTEDVILVSQQWEVPCAIGTWIKLAMFYSCYLCCISSASVSLKCIYIGPVLSSDTSVVTVWFLFFATA